MTVRHHPLFACDRKGCPRAATMQTTFETHRGTLNGPKACDKHVGWARAEAERMERS